MSLPPKKKKKHIHVSAHNAFVSNTKTVWICAHRMSVVGGSNVAEQQLLCMLGLNLADLLYVIGMIELLLFGVGVWWLRCHIISHHCSLLCEVCLAGLWCN